jgi:hypothetical protein
VAESVAERYLRLGLQLGQLAEGVVDAYFGPAALRAAVEAAAAVEPGALAAAADVLLGELDDGWLRDQVAGLRTYAGVLAGQAGSYAEEVAGCYGVRPVYTEEAVFATAHEQLAGLLPGAGPLAERYQRWRQAMLVPAGRVEPTMSAVIGEARAQTCELIELPAGEEVALETVADAPWLGYNLYLGDLRGRVVVNTGLPMSAIELLRLALHEAYPGHQAERASKEHLLVRGQGLLEETLVLAPTPQSVVSEGIAELAPQVLLEGDGGNAFAAILRDAGVEFDLAHAIAVERASEPCRWAQVNAALMLHQHRASEDEVREYLQHWGLMAAELAAHLIRFITEPDSRTYVITYPAGLELCRAYAAGQPERFRRLLTEQVRVPDLLAARDACSHEALPGPSTRPIPAGGQPPYGPHSGDG